MFKRTATRSGDSMLPVVSRTPNTPVRRAGQTIPQRNATHERDQGLIDPTDGDNTSGRGMMEPPPNTVISESDGQWVVHEANGDRWSFTGRLRTIRPHERRETAAPVRTAEEEKVLINQLDPPPLRRIRNRLVVIIILILGLMLAGDLFGTPHFRTGPGEYFGFEGSKTRPDIDGTITFIRSDRSLFAYCGDAIAWTWRQFAYRP